MRIGFFLSLSLVWLGCSTSESPLLDSEQGAGSIVWVENYDEAKAESKVTGKPVLVEFTADWCEPCQKLKRETYRSPKVVSASRGLICLTVDTASGSEVARDLVRIHSVDVLPTFIVLGTDGQAMPKHRRTGFMAAEAFRAYLEAIPMTP
mgnify:CR=1 FL=1